MSVAVNNAGEIKAYRPDNTKLDAIREYHFYTAYFG